jgi:hypothetical protein
MTTKIAISLPRIPFIHVPNAMLSSLPTCPCKTAGHPVIDRIFPCSSDLSARPGKSQGEDTAGHTFAAEPESCRESGPPMTLRPCPSCPCGLPPTMPRAVALHRRRRSCPYAEALMRSRYTAFTLGNEAYLRATWHPDFCRPTCTWPTTRPPNGWGWR